MQLLESYKLLHGVNPLSCAYVVCACEIEKASFYVILYVSKCSASVQIPLIQTVLTKHIKVDALGHKM